MEPTISGVGVLDKSMVIIGALERSPEPLTLAGLTEATGLPKPTVHRLLIALEAHGITRRDGPGGWGLGGRLIVLGRRATAGWTLLGTARPVLADLRDRTGESVQLYVTEAGGRRCIASLQSTQELRTIVDEGAILPLEVGSAGRVLRGETGTEGWIASIGERQSGVASVSAPVRVDEKVIAAIGVSGPIDRLGHDPGPRFGPAVFAAASVISDSAPG